MVALFVGEFLLGKAVFRHPSSTNSVVRSALPGSGSALVP
jgi:hypothetical protein